MSYLDSKYLNLASSQLQKYKKVKPGLWTFRCPYCGDSKKHKNKTRGYVFQVKGDHVYKCHNCGISRSFVNFLKEQNEDLYNEYLLERYQEGIGGRNVPQPDLTQFVSKPVFKPRPIDLKKVSDLNSLHHARAYLLGRGIPEDKLHLFYYCPGFKKWTNKQKEVFVDTKNDDDRIIIPLIDQDGKLFGFQGRSLDFNAKMRYITVMLDEDKPKIFGLDRMNKSEPVYVTEGPIDSTFLGNAIAMCGADVDVRSLDYKFVFVYDNEPRNKQIIERIESTIVQGYSVVIFPKGIQEKDLNDMHVAGHDVQRLVECNIYHGLEAKLKLADWKV